MAPSGPIASVLIPARNEASDIGRCLDAVLAQDLPLDEMEVVLVDGGSSDGTGEVASKRLASAGLGRFEVIDNPLGTTPSNLNAGLAAVQGRVVCRVDARSVIPPHYVRRCLEILDERPEVRVVGGAQVARARGTDARSLGIARALNNRFTMGMARYRRGASSGPTDTVYLGAFRTADLRQIGGWNEDFLTNQDFELNRRMGRDGVVWFCDELVVGYLPRSSVRELLSQYVRFGRWKARYWEETGDSPGRRQQVALAAGPVALIVLALGARGGWRRVGGITGAGLVALGLLEVGGASEPRGRPTAHLWAVPAMLATSGGWLWGAWASLARSLLRRVFRGGGR